MTKTFSPTNARRSPLSSMRSLIYDTHVELWLCIHCVSQQFVWNAICSLMHPCIFHDLLLSHLGLDERVKVDDGCIREAPDHFNFTKEQHKNLWCLQKGWKQSTNNSKTGKSSMLLTAGMMSLLMRVFLGLLLSSLKLHSTMMRRCLKCRMLWWQSTGRLAQRGACSTTKIL